MKDKFILKEIDIRAIILGAITDLGGTTLFSMFFYSLASMRLRSKGLDSEKIQEHIYQWSVDNEGFLFNLFFGLSFTFFGGYIATRFSKNETLINALVVGIISILSGLLFVDKKELPSLLLPSLLAIPAALAGGYHNLRQSTPTDDITDNSESDPK